MNRGWAGARIARGHAPWIALVALACSPPPVEPPAAPSAPAPRAVDRLLELADIESIVSARARTFTRQVALLGGDFTDRELERLVPAVQEGFASEHLRTDVASSLLEQAPDGWIEEVLGWLEGGANGEVRRITDAYEPPLSLRDWLDTYTTDPPSVERVRIVARWVEAQGTGTFFLLLEQALEEAAHTVLAEFRPTARPFSPLSGNELLTRLEASSAAAVVTAIHESETVPDRLIGEAAGEYESEAGQWFMETYQLAVAEAMRAAAARVVESLRS